MLYTKEFVILLASAYRVYLENVELKGKSENVRERTQGHSQAKQMLYH